MSYEGRTPSEVVAELLREHGIEDWQDGVLAHMRRVAVSLPRRGGKQRILDQIRTADEAGEWRTIDPARVSRPQHEDPRFRREYMATFTEPDHITAEQAARAFDVPRRTVDGVDGYEATWWAHDGDLSGLDQRPDDRSSLDACWRCDARCASTDVGLCDPCYTDLVGGTP